MGERNFNNIIEIIKNDFKSAFSNPIVTIVLIGLIILPSLYALINIQACWDPYGNTDDVLFAIANLDEGASYEGQKFNVGNELVKDLKNNDKFEWTFVTEEELREGVYNGDYYAGIVIPKNLSKNVISITTDDPKQAKLEYIVNMKENPVAAKLTDSGSTAVYNALNAKIIEIINLAAYGKLGELQEGLASGASQMSSGAVQLSNGAGQVSNGAGQFTNGAGQLSSGANELASGASQLSSGANRLASGAGQVSNGADQVASGTNKISTKANEVSTGVNELSNKIKEKVHDPVIDYEVDKINSKVSKVSKNISDLNDGAHSVADGSRNVQSGAGSLAGNASLLSDGANRLSSGSEELAKGALSLAAGAELLSNSAASALFMAAGSLASSADSLADITGINETLLGDYFYAPVKLDRHELFPVPNYGSQVSPFYIVLSMWVGALITCAMLKPGTSEGTKYSPLEMYSGKIVIFLIMGLLQACVTIIGSYILGIYIANNPLFIFSCLIVSGVFMVLVYSLVSALGDVGKAIAIVLLVIQISGTGGIYPVEIMAPLFNLMNPYLPMTYAITLIREAQLGLIWSNYLQAFVILFGIGLATVVVVIIIKEKADKATHYFEERLEDSGLF